jgi:CheY-like chemotaxis protein
MKKEKNAVINALVVDDNEVNTMILANMLEVFRIHVDQADHGMMAVQMAGEKEYDLIFVDHIMPKMNGVQTTSSIRGMATLHKPVIIALTSEINEHIRNIYQESGANHVYAKPLGLNELTSILKHWFPEVSATNIPMETQTDSSDQNNELIKSIIETMEDIEYSVGLKNALCNPIQFMHILEVSFKDIQSCITIIDNAHKKNSMKELWTGLHKLKNVFFCIGAMGHTEGIMLLEKAINEGDAHKFNEQYTVFINHLECFKEKICIALRRYDELVGLKRKETEQTSRQMTDEDYEQSLLKAIYYIRRYEYDFILGEMKCLIQSGRTAHIPDIRLAIEDIKAFDYEKALVRIMDIKNKTGIKPVMEN